MHGRCLHDTNMFVFCLYCDVISAFIHFFVSRIVHSHHLLVFCLTFIYYIYFGEMHVRLLVVNVSLFCYITVFTMMDLNDLCLHGL